MFGSPILDVAIGMAFIYLLLSLIASAVQEIFAALINARAANLQRGLRSLFSGDSLNSSTPLIDLLYGHGLVRGLYQDPKTDYGPGKQEPPEIRKLREFYGNIRLKLRALLRMKPPGMAQTVDDLMLPAYIPARTFALAMRDILNDPKPHGWDSLKNIEASLAALKAKYAKNKAVEALLTLVQDAAGDPDKLQRNLENWYNDAMDRVSGWYKKYVGNVLLFIGLGLAMTFNVDSIRVARVLWVNKDMREGLTTAAQQYLQKHPNAPPATSRQITEVKKPERPLQTQADGTSAMDLQAASENLDQKHTDRSPGQSTTASQETATAPQAQAGGSQSLDPQDLRKNLDATVAAFEGMAQGSLLPVGWKYSPHVYWEGFNANRLGFSVHVLFTLVGWILTAAALSMGAPFWFDTLNKFMVVRSTIKPQEKSQTEGSKD